MLALPWRRYSSHEYSIAGQRILCVELTNDPRGTGLIVWDGAFVLGKYLEKHYGQGLLANKVIVELGCGTGLAGFAAAALGAAKVFLTDLDYALANTRENLKLNPQLIGTVHCVELDWFFPHFGFLKDSRPSIILLADVAWVVELVEPLANACWSIDQHCESEPPLFILAHQTRSLRCDQALFDALKQRHFVVREVGANDYADGYDAVKLYTFCRKDTQ